MLAEEDERARVGKTRTWTIGKGPLIVVPTLLLRGHRGGFTRNT